MKPLPEPAVSAPLIVLSLRAPIINGRSSLKNMIKTRVTATAIIVVTILFFASSRFDWSSAFAKLIPRTTEYITPAAPTTAKIA